MPSPNRPKVGRPHLSRDNQKWVFDYVIKETGKTFHFQGDGRGRFPRSVKNHDMISKHMGLQGRRLEKLAQAEEAAGHRETALEIYFQAANKFHDAQHVVFETNDEKRYLHGSVLRCFDRVRELSPYPIEHVDIPWNGTIVSGNLHLCAGKSPAPCIFYIPGCDATKENWPHPFYNQAAQRGMNVFCFDGPGQGESNLRGIRLTDDNYEQAANAAFDYLVQRSEIDPARIVVYGLSFGSFWALRVAAYEPRARAVAAPWASYVDKYYLMTEESPRYKQLFAYLTQATTEAEVDAIANRMTMDGHMAKISCPTLLASGEYDPRSPIEEVYRIFDQATAPTELWVFADQHHQISATGGSAGAVWAADVHSLVCDWLRDRLEDRPMAHAGQVVYVDSASAGPNSQTVSVKRRWYE